MPLVISGKLSLPITGQPAANAEIRFRAVNSVGEIIEGAESVSRCSAGGQYSISLEFARYELATKISTIEFIVHGQVTIDIDTVAADLEDLIAQIAVAGAITDDLIKQFAQLKVEAEKAAADSKKSAADAKDSAKISSDAEAAITPMYNYFNTNYQIFTVDYQDFSIKYPDVVRMHGEVVVKAGEATLQAKHSANSAAKSSNWAVGPSGSGQTPSDTNNSWYWAEQAKYNANQTFISGGLFTPTPSNEYPDVSSVVRDTIWIINFPSHSTTYTYTSGQLSGETVKNGDMIFWDTPNNVWNLIPTAISGVLSVDGNIGPNINLESKYYWSGNSPSINNVTGLDDELKNVANSAASHNILYNTGLAPEWSPINQRNFDGNWSSLSDGDYGFDGWIKYNSTHKAQIIEMGEFKNQAYALSIGGVASGQITPPDGTASHWLVAVPFAADMIDLRVPGSGIAWHPETFQEKQSKCQSRYWVMDGRQYTAPATSKSDETTHYQYAKYPITMRTTPLATATSSSGSVALVTPYKDGANIVVTGITAGTVNSLTSVIADSTLKISDAGSNITIVN